MVLSNEQIVSFQTLYKSQFGKEISQAEALKKGIKLIRLVQLIYKPMTEDEHKILQMRRQETAGS